MITKRDEELFLKLSRFALMSTKQIAKTVFNEIAITTVLRRLRKLEVMGYIQRIEGLPNAEKAWTVTEKGALGLSDRVPRRNFNPMNLLHDTKLTDLRLALEGHGIAHSWIPEHEIRSKMARAHGLKYMKQKTVPDGIMGVEYQGVKESVAVELELNFKNEGRYRETFRNYRHKDSLWAVWYVVHTASLGRHLNKLWRKQLGETSRPSLMWSLYDDVLNDPTSAVVHNYDRSFVLGKILAPKALLAPAQDDAHGVGKESDKKSETKTVLTLEKTTDTLTPSA